MNSWREEIPMYMYVHHMSIYYTCIIIHVHVHDVHFKMLVARESMVFGRTAFFARYGKCVSVDCIGTDEMECDNEVKVILDDAKVHWQSHAFFFSKDA